jgi:hypothetical protein
MQMQLFFSIKNLRMEVDTASNADSEIDPLDAYMAEITQKSRAGGEVIPFHLTLSIIHQ